MVWEIYVKFNFMELRSSLFFPEKKREGRMGGGEGVKSITITINMCMSCPPSPRFHFASAHGVMGSRGKTPRIWV